MFAAEHFNAPASMLMISHPDLLLRCCKLGPSQTDVSKTSTQADLHLYTSRQIQLHQCIYCLFRGLYDIQQTLVRADLILITGILVHVRRNKDGVSLSVSRKRDGTSNLGSGTLRGIDYFLSRLINQPMIKGLQPNSDALILHLLISPKSFQMKQQLAAPEFRKNTEKMEARF
jgi:hypothetical protein